MISKRLYISLICLLLGFAAYSQNVAGSFGAERQREVQVPSFKLYPTKSSRVFLKLDTRRGLVEMVEYGWKEKYRHESTINCVPLATGDEAVPGRFNLYPTEDTWNFLLLDELDGRTWQVQWSYDGAGELFPINNQPSKYN